MARLFHRPAMVFALWAASQMASAGVCVCARAWPHTQTQPTVQLVATATPTCVCQASGYSTKLESERSGWCRSCGYMLLASARSRPVQDLSVNTFNSCIQFFVRDILTPGKIQRNVALVEFMAGAGGTSQLVHAAGHAAFTIEMRGDARQDCCTLVVWVGIQQQCRSTYRKASIVYQW